MRMRSPSALYLRAVWLISGMLFLAPGMFAQKPSAATARAEAMTFNAVCGGCHPTTLISDVRSESEWRETIDQMVSLGAEATEAQFEQVLRYLLRTRTRVNVNSASAAEIAAVLEISAPAAESLVKYRTNKGGFKTLDELKRVPGIDAAALETKKDRVVF